MKKVLYISYTGMLEPLGASQVLNYVKGLSGEYSFWLISLEKMEDYENKKAILNLRDLLLEKNIIWNFLPYKQGGKNYLKNFYGLYLLAKKYVDEENIRFVHCRSYMPAIIAWLLKKKGKKIAYLFDTRGFWVDEKADVGDWNRRGLQYRIAKLFEKKLYTQASSIVMLSKNSVEFIKDGLLFSGSERLSSVHFIPTCTDLERFKPNYDKKNTPIKIGYIGTAVSWYNFNKTAELLQILKKDIDFQLEIYNGGQHEFIKNVLTEYGFNEGDYLLKKVSFEEIPQKMRELDLSIFFIHPFFSKRASAATKFGELMASGVPIITNKGIGDHEYFIEKYKTGKILDVDKLSSYSYSKIIENLTNKESSKNCRKIARDVFSLQKGIDSYKELYEKHF